jgi:gliding motility-associated-like protein
MRIITLLQLSFGFAALPALAGPPTVVGPAPSSTVEFVANQRQWAKPVLFAADVPSGRLFMERGRLVQALYDGKQADALHDQGASASADQRVKAHAYATTFVGANPKARVAGEAKLPGYSNFFLGNDQSRWSSNVPGYGEVRYQGLYPGIDLHFYSKERVLEYDFEVAAGADAQRIKLRYDGQTKLQVVDGALHIGTSVGTVVEQRPYAYQIVKGQRQRVSCEYTLTNGNILTFKMPKGYNHALPLVIDPVLVYSTYTGSTASNYGYTAAFDSLGNLYAGGSVFATGYPTTVGAYDVSFGGSTDMGIIKYNPSAATRAASRVYATYIGGSTADHPHSLVVDGSNHLIILGSTSSSNYPTTTGAYDTSLGGSTDIVVTKLNATGSALVGSTYLGGSTGDGQLNASALRVNYGDSYRGDITTDLAGNIYLASVTESTNFPVIGGVQSSRAGSSDAVVVKFNPGLTAPIWSTYLGGSGDDTGYSVQLDSVNNVFVGGGTTSTNFPGRTGGFRATYQGGTADGFIARINAAGTTLVQSTYLGTSAYDQTHFVQLNRRSEVYAYGQTYGAYPVTTGVYSNAGSRQYIQKLNATLTAGILSTVIGNGSGSGPNLSPTAFLVDNCGQILFSGWGGGLNGGSISGMPLAGGPLQSSSTSGFYIAQLSPDARQLVFGTYFGSGGAHVDGGTSRFDKRGIIYQSMCASSSANIQPTANAWSATCASSYNNAAFKMDVLQLNPNFIPALTATSTIRRADLCAPAQFYFNRPGVTGTSVLWTFGNGQTSTQTNNATTTYTTPGRYPVRLTVFDTNGCLPTVSSVDTVTVYAVPRPQVTATSRQTICIGSSASLSATNLATGTPAVVYTWTAPGQPARTGPSITVQPTVTTKYTVTLATPSGAGGCTATDTVTVRVLNEPLNASFIPALTATSTTRQAAQCAPAQFYFNRPAVVGTGVVWDFGNGQTSTQVNNVPVTYTVPGRYPISLTVSNTNGCGQVRTTVDTVVVYAVPRAQITPTSRQDVCIGNTTTLSATNLVTNAPNVTYTWTAPGQPARTGPSITVQPTVTTFYTVTLATPGGCTSTDTVTVRVLNEPLDASFIPALTASATTRQAGQCAPAQFYFNRPAVVGTNVVWDFGNGQTSTQVNNVPVTFTAPGRYPVRLTVSNSNGCAQSRTTVDTVVVYAVPRPQVTPASRELVCLGSSTTLAATNLNAAAANVTYTWTAPGLPTLTGASITITPTATVQYTVTASTPANAGSCSEIDTVTVHVLERLVVSAGPAREICPGSSITLTVPSAGPNATYTWTAPDQPTLSGQSITVQPASSVRYRVAVQNQYGCQGRDSVQVNVASRPTLAATVSTPNISNEPVTFSNTSTGATSYRWDFGDNSPVSTDISPMHTYTTVSSVPFQARLTAIYGPANCEETIVVPVTVRGFALPNIITPNNDGLNDTFRPFVTSESVSIKVFNRWGRTVYESTNYVDGWGADAAAGTYYYYIVSTNGASWKGWVEVVR